MYKDVWKQAKTVAIGGHIRPDGDCVGSCMGLYLYLKEHYPDIEADVYLEKIPDTFLFIKDVEKIRHVADESKVYDLFVSLDCGDADRLSFSKVLFEQAKKTFCVDHHISNQAYADENYIVPEASSTSELVYHLMEPDKISREVAECLYMGIAHDTGIFQYSCTSPETMEIAANLMRKGIRASEIIEKTYYEKTYAQNQILGRALLESFMLMDGKCIVSYISKKEMDFHEVTTQDLEGIVSQLRMTKGVEVAIFLYELSHQEYKVSMRANGDVDVSKVAQYFGGGGHKRAAGLTMKGTVHDVINNLTEQIHMQL